jgi:hypothetical protein
LNAITKKNRYSISLIAETIAQLFKTKWMTKIDIRHAFNRIRMHSKENEDLTTFKIKYDTYKYLIMSFELTNESSIFQNFMNDILMNYLNKFVIAYLNNIVIYSNNKKKHVQHVKKILQRLREANIQIDVDKCEFHIIETKFLKMIIDREDIKMNFEKIRTIVEWDTSNHLKNVQAFLRFVNFYKRFVKKIVDKINQKDSFILLNRELSNNIRTAEEANHRSARIVILLIWIRDVCRIKFIWLRLNRSFISKKEWWSYQINNLFLEDVVFNQMQLWDLR